MTAGIWGWPFYVGTALLAAQLVPVSMLLLRYPQARLSCRNRAVVVVVAVVTVGLPVLNQTYGLGRGRALAATAAVAAMVLVCLAALRRLSSVARIARRGRALRPRGRPSWWRS